jgi:hypothetical protein
MFAESRLHINKSLMSNSAVRPVVDAMLLGFGTITLWRVGALLDVWAMFALSGDNPFL